MADSDGNESWGWIAFWFFGSFFVAMAAPPLGIFSLGLAIWYTVKRLSS